MDILSFALGMVTVAVIAIVIVAVVALVKARKNEKNLEEFMVNISHEITHINEKIDKRVEETHRDFIMNDEDIYRQITNLESHSHRRMDDIISQMDSRLDKQQDKINKALGVLTSKLSDFFDVKEIDNNNNNNKILLKD